MSLVKSKELFAESALPVTVDSVVGRTLVQKDLHRHEYFELLYVERGRLVNRFKSDEVELHDGDVLVMKPYVRHVLGDCADVPPGELSAYCCSFLPRAVDSGIESLESLSVSDSPNRFFFSALMALTDQSVSALQITLDPDLRKRFVEDLEGLRETTHRADERSLAQTRHRFLDLLLVLAEQHARNPVAAQPIRTTAQLAVPLSRYQAGIRKALAYMHDHFNEPLSLSDVAAMCGASETYFCRLFKHETGMTFLNYLNGLRIERSCVLLRNTADSALEICYKVGFNDYTHFGRQFRKHTGVSPAEFRRRYRKANGAAVD